MNIHYKDLIASGIVGDLASMIEVATESHVETNRRSKVSLSVTVSTDTQSGKTKAVGRVHAVLPTGDSDSITRKLAGIVLFSTSHDHPGQQRLDPAADVVRVGKDAAAGA